MTDFMFYDTAEGDRHCKIRVHEGRRMLFEIFPCDGGVRVTGANINIKLTLNQDGGYSLEPAVLDGEEATLP